MRSKALIKLWQVFLHYYQNAGFSSKQKTPEGGGGGLSYVALMGRRGWMGYVFWGGGGLVLKGVSILTNFLS